MLIGFAGGAGGCAHPFASVPYQRYPASHGWVVVRPLTLTAQKGAMDCGPAALATLLSHWETSSRVPSREMSAAESQGWKAKRLRDSARAAGHPAFLVEGSVADLQHEISLGRPVIIGLFMRAGARAVGHYAVVAGINLQRRELLLGDPQVGWEVLSWNEVEPGWNATGHLTLVVLPPGPRDLQEEVN